MEKINDAKKPADIFKKPVEVLADLLFAELKELKAEIEKLKDWQFNHEIDVRLNN